mmetsp:Transcript_40905/g.59774  ORF Transcript_40905/g.59774 Transcript_40905/m.59774 type:complete len:441 (-) Transcript_40905:248-1570(-)
MRFQFRHSIALLPMYMLLSVGASSYFASTMLSPPPVAVVSALSIWKNPSVTTIKKTKCRSEERNHHPRTWLHSSPSSWNGRTCKSILCSNLFLYRGGGTSLRALSNEEEKEHATAASTSSQSQKTSPSTITKDMTSYHLLWSPGFFHKIMTSSLFIFMFHSLLRRISISIVLPQFFTWNNNAHPSSCSQYPGTTIARQQAGSSTMATTTNTLMKLLNFVALPLLSSSCCAIQLLLNAISAGLGCVGFNSYLGPLRPYFLSFLMYSTTILSFPSSSSLIEKGAFRRSTQKWVITFVVSWLIALMPEIVYAWNNVSSRRRVTSIKKEDNSALETTKATLELDIPSMGCVACINKINSSIRQQEEQPNTYQFNILDASSWLTTTTKDDSNNSERKKKGGKAKISFTTSSKDAVENAVDDIVNSVEKSGFACYVDKLSIEGLNT